MGKSSGTGNPGPVAGSRDWSAVLIVHGSPDERGNEHARATFEKLRKKLSPNIPMEMALAFIDHAEPDVGSVIDRLADRSGGIGLFPFLLFDAGHSKSDVSGYMNAASEAHPETPLIRDWALGTDQKVVSILLDMLPKADPAIRDTVILIGRGSLDPNANASLYYQGRRLWERRRGAQPVFAFISVTDPRLSEVLDSLDPGLQDRILLVPYFLFEGVLLDRIRGLAEAYRKRTGFGGEVIVTPPFGDHPMMLDYMTERIRRVLKLGRTPMPKWPILDFGDGSGIIRDERPHS